jgi:hypothetical protein
MAGVSEAAGNVVDNARSATMTAPVRTAAPSAGPWGAADGVTATLHRILSQLRETTDPYR